MSAANRVAVLFSNLGHLMTHLCMVLYPTAVLALEREFALGYGELITLSLPAFVLFGAGALPAGWLGDRWSAVGMIGVLLFGLGAASIVTGLATTPLGITVGLALIGLSASIYHPVGIAMVVRHAARRGRALGTNGVFGGIGLASGPIVAGVLTDTAGWRAAFLVPGVLALAVGVLYVVLARRTGLRDTHDDAHPEPAHGASGRGVVAVFTVLILMTLCSGLIFQINSVALPKIFADRLPLLERFSAASAGGLVTLVFVVTSVFQIVGGHLADRFSLKRVYLSAYVLQVPVILTAAVLYNWPLLLTVLVMAMLHSGAAPAENGLFARYSSARWRATAFGLKFVVALGVAALGVPLVAFIFEMTGGFFWLFIAMAAMAVSAVLAAVMLPSEPGRAALAPSAAAAAPGD